MNYTAKNKDFLPFLSDILGKKNEPRKNPKKNAIPNELIKYGDSHVISYFDIQLLRV